MPDHIPSYKDRDRGGQRHAFAFGYFKEIIAALGSEG